MIKRMLRGFVFSMMLICGVKVAQAPEAPPQQFYRKLVAKGHASFYGDGFHGKLTASGTKFNKYRLTAAHRTLPFGTKLEVYNPRNKRHVVVTITDRGPFVGRRIIDLSEAAAKKLGITGVGTVALYTIHRR